MTKIPLNSTTPQEAISDVKRAFDAIPPDRRDPVPPSSGFESSSPSQRIAAF
jgi:hypothetical protein